MVRHDASIARWLQAAVADAEARGLPELKGLLEGLAESTRALRAADLGDSRALDATGATSATNVSPAGAKGDEPVGHGSPCPDDADDR